MTSATTDRRLGLAGNTAYKVPATVVATANIVLSGEQTIDTVACKASNAAGRPDRVLCTAQTSGAQNGLWDVSTGTWTRSIDANGNYDLVNGTQVEISQGSNARSVYLLTTADPITVDTTVQTWVASPAVGFLAALANTTDITKGAALVGYLPDGASAVGRTVFSVLRERKNFTDYLTTAEITDITSGTGSIDVAAKLRTAISESAGRLLLLPYGVIKLSSAVTHSTAKVWIEGQASGTRLMYATTGGDIFTLGDGSNEITKLVFSDFDIWSSVAKSSGWAFNARKLTNSYFVNVRAGSVSDFVANGHRLWGGMNFNQFGVVNIEGGEVVTANDGISCNGDGAGLFGAELSIDGGTRINGGSPVIGDTGAGVRLAGGAGGVNLRRVDISACRMGVVCDQSVSATTNRELFISDQASIDSCPGVGLWVKANGLAILDASNIWVSGCGRTGSGTTFGVLATQSETAIRIEASSGLSAMWGSPRVQSSSFDGFSIVSGIHSISGGYIRTNGLGALGGHGVNYGGGSGLNINGCMIHGNGNGARGTGVAIGGSLTFINVSNNTLFSNGVADITSASAAGDTVVIEANASSSFRTANTGTATITAGNSSIVVNHGLGAAPSSVLIEESGAYPTAPAYHRVAPGNYTATQFTIEINAISGANRDFVWRAWTGISS